jgi:hypothetical protein
MYGTDTKGATVAFEAQGRRVRFFLPMPDKADKMFTKTPGGRRERNPQSALAVWEQATRQRWRALLLVIKAKLEAVESGITDFESEFLAHIILPNGATVGMWMTPQIKRAYETEKMPPMLPAHEDDR